MSPTVLMTAPALAPGALALLKAAGCDVAFTEPYPSESTLIEAVRRTRPAAILCRQGRVTARVLEAAKGLVIVARHGVGVDEVDVEAASRLGIIVTRTPGANARAVAEHAMTLILALVKDLPGNAARVGSGGWRGEAVSRDVAGLRLGLVGFGASARALAGFAASFGMVVAATSPSGRIDGGVRAIGAIEPLLAASDVVSLHCPLNAATRHLLDATRLACLPRGALLVNVARGGLVDEAALLAALDGGAIAGAGLDVFETEPPPLDHPLRRHPRVIATTHLAGVTEGSLASMGEIAASCIVAALAGRPIPPERVVAG